MCLRRASHKLKGDDQELGQAFFCLLNTLTYLLARASGGCAQTLAAVCMPWTAGRMCHQGSSLSLLCLVPNISLDVLQPSFPEVFLESHMVMIRVRRPLPLDDSSVSSRGLQICIIDQEPWYRSTAPSGRTLKGSSPVVYLVFKGISLVTE